MQNEQDNRYEILRHLALAGVNGDDLAAIGQVAIDQAAQIVGLAAAAVFLWDDKGKVTLSVSTRDNEKAGAKLEDLEKTLFRTLRNDADLVAAYMTFAGAPPFHSFTLPLRRVDRIFGAVIGLHRGERSLVAEDNFLEALSAALALNVLVSEGITDIPADVLKKARLEAILETAVTVNHEINNPLTAILGNVQLLLIRKEELSDELKAKLEVIESSALKIKDVTQKLLRLTQPKSKDYASGTKMIDLGDDEPSQK